MSDTEKLTKPQRRLLEDVAAGDDRCVKVYATANWLVTKGYLEWFDDDEFSGRLRVPVPTTAGDRDG